MTEKTNTFFIYLSLSPHSTLSFGIVTGNKSRPVFSIPPPTTVIGALSYPLAKIEGEAESGKNYMPAVLARALEGVYVTVDGPAIPYTTITRMWFYDPDDKVMRSDAYGYQRLYVRPRWAKGPSIKAIYVFDAIKAEKLFGQKWKEKLLASAAAVLRLGDKESIVSVEAVDYGEAEALSMDKVETRYIVPMSERLAVKPAELGQEVEVYEFYDWRKLKDPNLVDLPTTRVAFAYDRKNFSAGKLIVEALESGKVKAYKLNLGKEVEYVVSW